MFRCHRGNPDALVLTFIKERSADAGMPEVLVEPGLEARHGGNEFRRKGLITLASPREGGGVALRERFAEVVALRGSEEPFQVADLSLGLADAVQGLKLGKFPRGHPLILAAFKKAASAGPVPVQAAEPSCQGRAGLVEPLALLDLEATSR